MTKLERNYTVFEVINERRREIYVAKTDKAMFELVLELRRRLPPGIAAWRQEDITAIRSVEFSLTSEDADFFIKNYRGTGLPENWKFV